METTTYENKVLKRPADNDAGLTASIGEDLPRVSRKQLEQTRDIVLSAIASEVDPDRLNDSILRLTKLNLMIAQFDQIEVAKAQASAAREEYSRQQAALAAREQEAFLNNCNLVVMSILDRQGLTQRHFGDPSDASLQKITSRYFKEVFQALSFDDCRKQVDEILQASVERRDWKLVVRVPPPPTGKGRSRINPQTGEYL